MVIEMQTYTLKTRSVGSVVKMFEEALPARTALSPLAAFWRTEVGVLNQIIMIWPYASADERDRMRAAELKIAGWPLEIRDHVLEESTLLWTPAPFSPPLTPRRLGNIYEVRIYDYEAGSIPWVIDSWNEILEERLKYSPLVGAWYADTGPVHRWIHIWAYENAGERERIRAETTKAGIWPMSAVDQRLKRETKHMPVRMQNMLTVPAPFSPLR